MHARLRGSKSLVFTLYQIINKPDFPSLADEIAEPRPDMNIKVAAFTVSEKSSNIKAISQQQIVSGFLTSDCSYTRGKFSKHDQACILYKNVASSFSQWEK